MKFIIKLCAIALLIQPLCAESWSGKVHCSFGGSSTLHDYQGEANAPIQAEHNPTGHWQFKASVAIKDMSTDNASRDKNMQKMFHSDEYPTIKVTTKKLSLATDSAPQTLSIEVSIAGKTKIIAAKCSKWSLSKTNLEFDLDFPISLTEYGLERPKAMFGLIVVDDKVNVSTHIVMKADQGA